MMTLAAFRIRYPEFSSASDALVQACLDEAEERSLGGQTTAHGLLAAHLLAVSPVGRSIRTISNPTTEDQETTIYWREYLKISRMKGAGPWVA